MPEETAHLSERRSNQSLAERNGANFQRRGSAGRLEPSMIRLLALGIGRGTIDTLAEGKWDLINSLIGRFNRISEVFY